MNEDRCHRYQSEDGVEVILAVHCPACGYDHPFRIAGDGPKWTWNGDFVKPTFSPSMLVDQGGTRRCHSFVKDGMIEYLNDCWHEQRNTTVALPVYDDS